MLKNGVDRLTREYRALSVPPPAPGLVSWRFLAVSDVAILAVYSDGRIWNLREERWVKTYRDKDGYEITGYGKVHRLVLLAFKGRPKNHRQVRHLDGDPNNNQLENLVWGTGKENWRDRKRHYGPSGGNVSQAGIPRPGAGNFRGRSCC